MNCRHCSLPMKEYLGFDMASSGEWDCLNKDCTPNAEKPTVAGGPELLSDMECGPYGNMVGVVHCGQGVFAADAASTDPNRIFVDVTDRYWCTPGGTLWKRHLGGNWNIITTPTRSAQAQTSPGVSASYSNSLKPHILPLSVGDLDSAASALRLAYPVRNPGSLHQHTLQRLGVGLLHSLEPPKLQRLAALNDRIKQLDLQISEAQDLMNVPRLLIEKV